MIQDNLSKTKILLFEFSLNKIEKILILKWNF